MTGLFLGLLLLAQAQAPTVGDTIWVSRSVTLPEGAEVRPAVWQLEGDVVLLGRPRVHLEAGRATVRYPVVAWATGTHTLDVPGPVIVTASGRTDSLPSQQVSITVGSVLPPGTDADEAPIQAETGLMRETATTPVPVGVFLGSAMILFLPLAWWWRRRRAPVGESVGGPPAVILPVEAWSEDGELRAVAAATARQVRASLVAALPGAQAGLVTSRLVSQAVARRPALPVDELSEVLGLLESAAFSPQGATDVPALAARAGRLRERLRGSGA